MFGERWGARGLCGGHGTLEAGASLSRRSHAFDKSITIVRGRAICQVGGTEYEIAGCDTVCVPAGRPYRLFNRFHQPMDMIWVYAGDELDCIEVDSGAGDV